MGERGRTTTRAMQDLCDALADMFGLPPLPIPQPPPVRSPSPMAAISTSQSHCNELRHSPSAPLIPATRCHSPEPEAGPSKQPITWDLKDPAHPLHRWGMQQAYKEHIKQARYDYPVPHSPSVKSGSHQYPRSVNAPAAPPQAQTIILKCLDDIRAAYMSIVPHVHTEDALPPTPDGILV